MEYQDIAVRTIAVGVPKFVRDMTTAADAVDRVGQSHSSLAESAAGSADAHASAAMQFGNFVDRVGGGLEKHGKTLDRWGKKLTQFGLNASLWALPLAAGVKTGIDSYTQFAEALSLVQRQANATGKEVHRWGRQIQKMGPMYGSPLDLAKALYYPASSFANEKGARKDRDVMNALRASAMLAKIGGDTPEEAAMALKSVINANLRGTAGGHSFRNFEQIASVFDQAVGEGDMRLPDLLGSFSTEVLPEAKAAGMSLQGILAYTASLTKLGVPARVANSLSKLTITRMMAPTKQGIAAMHMLGFANPYQLGADLKKTGNFLLPFHELEQHLNRLPAQDRTAALSAIFGGSRGLPNAKAIMQTLGDYGGIVSHLNQSATVGTFQRHFRQYEATPGAKMAAFQAQMQKTEMVLGQTIFPTLLTGLTELSKVVQTAVGVFSGLPKWGKDAIGGLALLGPAMVVFGPFLRTISLIEKLGGKGLRGAGWLFKKMGKDDIGNHFDKWGGGRSPLSQIARLNAEQVGLLRVIAEKEGFGGSSSWDGIANDFHKGRPKWEQAALDIEKDGEKVSAKGGILSRVFGEGGKLSFLGSATDGITSRLSGLLPFLGEGTGLTGSLTTILPLLGTGGGLAGMLSGTVGALALATPEIAAFGAAAAGAFGLGKTLGTSLINALGLNPNINQLHDSQRASRWAHQAGKLLPKNDSLGRNLIANLAAQAGDHHGHVPYKNGKLYLGAQFGWVPIANLEANLNGLKLPSWLTAPHLTNKNHQIIAPSGLGKTINVHDAMGRMEVKVHTHLHLGGREIAHVTEHINAHNRREMNRR